jgi:hypothetical protein
MKFTNKIAYLAHFLQSNIYYTILYYNFQKDGIMHKFEPAAPPELVSRHNRSNNIGYPELRAPGVD